MTNPLKNLILNSIKIKYNNKKQTVPSYSFMLQKFSRIIALGFGSGLFTLFPGTMGTLFGWTAFNLLNINKLSILNFSMLSIILLILGSWACNQTQQSLGKQDSGYIVFDEWLGIWLCFWVLSFYSLLSLSQQIGIFLVFRLFDMLKPFPIKHVESYFKNRIKSDSFLSGFGIMIDDILAAFYTILIFKLL